MYWKPRRGSGRATRLGPCRVNPRPAYDPDRTTLTQRRHAKVAETKAMHRPEAVRLGLQHLGYRTLEGLSRLSGDSLLLACADGRWTRRRSGHRSVTEEVREAIFAVQGECGERASLSLAAKHRLMHQYIRERFPTFPTEKIPSRWTLAAVWKEWFGLAAHGSATSGRPRPRRRPVSPDGWWFTGRARFWCWIRHRCR